MSEPNDKLKIMEKGYPMIIYILVIFCGGCAMSEVFQGTATAAGVLLILSGLGLLVYLVRSIEPEDNTSTRAADREPFPTTFQTGDKNAKN